jgi:hypothetical protein
VPSKEVSVCLDFIHVVDSRSMYWHACFAKSCTMESFLEMHAHKHTHTCTHTHTRSDTKIFNYCGVTCSCCVCVCV